MIHGTNTITEKSADILIKRGAKPSPCGTGVVYTRDIKNRITPLYGFTQDVILRFAQRVTCPHLIVKAKDIHFLGKKGKVNDREASKIYKDNPKFVYAEIEGSHHVHLNDPDLVMQHIRPFLSSNEFKKEEMIKM